MRRTLLAALATTAMATMAHAGVVDLNFEGINSTYPSGFAFINGFYDGGTSSDGTSGPNFGVTFSANAQAICLNSLSVVCSNTSRGGLAPSSSEGGLFFLSGTSTTIDVAAGFTTGFSFNYTNPTGIAASVEVWSGLDGTGTELGSFNLSTTPNGDTACPGYSAAFCPFEPIGVNFSGTAESIVFGGVANEVVFDDVTFGSSSPGTVPEPATWATMLTGLAAAGAMLRRRRAPAAI
jgi:PEP-CTERM motif